jgi:PIN domain nuclease of toxin-antitoxin system
MRLLIDTHILLWLMIDSPRITPEARRILTSEQNTVMTSAVSFTEIAIKWSLGRRDIVCSAADVLAYVNQAAVPILSWSVSHALALERLPWHHRDLFDRMLVAQATAESMKLISHDKFVSRYAGAVIAV